jgi:hypothetical protein
MSVNECHSSLRINAAKTCTLDYGPDEADVPQTARQPVNDPGARVPETKPLWATHATESC